MTDLILAIGHHLAVFSLAAILAGELALLRPGLDARGLGRLGALDLAYGAVAGLVVVIGIVRVFFADKGADYYLHNGAFWLKMASFVIVGLLSVPPTMTILRWRREAKSDAAFNLGEAAVNGVRRYFFAEAAGFALILIFAAAMARGYGVM